MESTNSEEDVLYAEVGNFFLQNDKLHDVQFIVGEQKEKIKAVKLQLINQSRVWWSMLSDDSPLAEKGDIHLPDIDPEVFTLLLKHSYGGLDKLEDLSDDMVIKLCYCANKYLMKSLMAKISVRLEPSDVESVFPALHCLAYYNLHGVEDSVKKIVQTKTKKVFNHPKFLECDVDSITYICKQDALGCDELTLWKAVVSWAQHKAQGAEGAQLRQWLSQPLQHIRLLTLNKLEFYDHVLTSGILTGEEVTNVCLYKSSQQSVSSLASFCYNKSARLGFSISNVEFSVDIRQRNGGENKNFGQEKTSCSCFVVKSNQIELKSISVKGLALNHFFTDYRGLFYSDVEYSFDINIKITRITDLIKNMSDEEPVTLNIKDLKHYILDRVVVPTVINGKGIILEANSKYIVELTFNKAMSCFIGPDCVHGHEFDHGTFYCCLAYNMGKGVTPCHIVQFTYGVAVD